MRGATYNLVGAALPLVDLLALGLLLGAPTPLLLAALALVAQASHPFLDALDAFFLLLPLLEGPIRLLVEDGTAA